MIDTLFVVTFEEHPEPAFGLSLSLSLSLFSPFLIEASLVAVY
jgi:hypothetical protein